MGRTWGTPEQLRALLEQLVGWPSTTGSDGEAAFPRHLHALLADHAAFRDHPDRVAVHPVAHVDRSDRALLTALHRGTASTGDAVVLLSHFDTVSTEDYGELEPLARDPARLAAALAAPAVRAGLTPEARSDLDAGGWLWGRGTMDMKAGLAVHLALLDRAAAEDWPLDLLLLTVPDEEDGSAGMRAAVEELVRLREQHHLRFRLFLNGEFSYPQPTRDVHGVHTGSIGKLMPAAFVHGVETHAGEPLAGVTSSWIAAHITRAVEWSDALRETAHGETSPPPVALEVRDVREGYSVKTPHRTRMLFNAFVLERSAEDVLAAFEDRVGAAVASCTADLAAVRAREGLGEPSWPAIRVLRFDALVAHARDAIGDVRTDELLALAAVGPGDVRDQAFDAVDRLLHACPELTPVVVVLFAPPAYPAVCSTGDPLLEAAVDQVAASLRTRFGLGLVRGHFFPGISDLSFVDHAPGAIDGWASYGPNTPGWGRTYVVPFEAMAELRAPVLNLGPLGKDAHTRTERLHVRSAFHELPELLADLLRALPDLLARIDG